MTDKELKAAMADLYAKCPTCGNVWCVAKLPQTVRKVGKLARAARCPCGSDEKPILPQAHEIPK